MNQIYCRHVSRFSNLVARKEMPRKAIVRSVSMWIWKMLFEQITHSFFFIYFLLMFYLSFIFIILLVTLFLFFFFYSCGAHQNVKWSHTKNQNDMQKMHWPIANSNRTKWNEIFIFVWEWHKKWKSITNALEIRRFMFVKSAALKWMRSVCVPISDQFNKNKTATTSLPTTANI